MYHSAPSPGLAETATCAHQRAHGRATVEVSHRRGRTRLDDLHQAGSAKAFLPPGNAVPEIVFLNTAGGLTGGDRLHYGVCVGAGSAARATTQTAERAYASPGGPPARATVRLDVGPDARLDWLPQETILFEHSDLSRDTVVDLARGAQILLCEAVVLGRVAMGETIVRARLFDRRVVQRDGRPILIDTLALGSGDYVSGPAGLGGARAVAMLALVGQGVEDAADGLRRRLAACAGIESAVSGWDGRCIARLRAADGLPLRRALAAAVTAVRPGPLPRVWQI